MQIGVTKPHSELENSNCVRYYSTYQVRSRHEDSHSKLSFGSNLTLLLHYANSIKFDTAYFVC